MVQAAWIGGWGVAPEALRPLAEGFMPRAQHTFFTPAPDAPSKASASNCVIAWSLGALRVLNWAAVGGRFRGKVFLLSPFLAFCSEFALGGKCSRTQVRFLRRWLERDPDAALKDFYARAVLSIPFTGLPYPLNELLDGLDALESDASAPLRQFAAEGLPKGWKAVVGMQDTLLQPEVIAQTLKGCLISERAAHSPDLLLQTFKGDLDAV